MQDKQIKSPLFLVNEVQNDMFVHENEKSIIQTCNSLIENGEY